MSRLPAWMPGSCVILGRQVYLLASGQMGRSFNQPSWAIMAIYLYFLRNFIYWFAESLLLRGLFSTCGDWGLFSRYSAWASECRGFSCCGSRAQLPHCLWDLPRSGIAPMSPVLAGRFFIAEPPGKPNSYLLSVQKRPCFCPFPSSSLLLLGPVPGPLPPVHLPEEATGEPGSSAALARWKALRLLAEPWAAEPSHAGSSSSPFRRSGLERNS